MYTTWNKTVIRLNIPFKILANPQGGAVHNATHEEKKGQRDSDFHQ